MSTTSSKSKARHTAMLLPVFPSKLSVGFGFAYMVSFSFLLMCVKTCFFDFGDAESALAFYGAYHRNPYNQLIHFVGVPVIIWTLVVISAHLVLFPNAPLIGGAMMLPGIPKHSVNLGTLWSLMYAAFYISMDVQSGLLYSPLLYIYYATAIHWVRNDQKLAADAAKDKVPSWMGTGKLIQWSILLHVLSWYVQIHPGHQILEGASPAVLANVGGALTAAPLFAFYEGVWFLGLRQDLQQRVQGLVSEYTRDLCQQQGATMRVCQEILEANAGAPVRVQVPAPAVVPSENVQ